MSKNSSMQQFCKKHLGNICNVPGFLNYFKGGLEIISNHTQIAEITGNHFKKKKMKYLDKLLP